MLLALLLGLGVGLALGMLGGGGAILIVPVLVYVVGQDAQEATTASLVIVTVAAAVAGLAQSRLGNVCWNHAAVFTLAALPAIVLGTLAGNAVSGSFLLGVFGAVMLVAAVATAHKQALRERVAGSERCPTLRSGWDVGFGALVGFLTGFLGIGGGFIVIPVLALALNFPMRTAIGTSLVIITSTGVLGAFVHLLAGRSVDLEVTGAMTAVVVAGAIAGVFAGRHVAEVTLARAFALLVSAVGIYLIVASLFFGGPQSA